MSDYFPRKHRPGLFRSIAWLDAWQQTWGNYSAIENSNLSGVLPCNTKSEINAENPGAQSCYTYTQKVKKILPLKTGFPLGISTPAAPSIRSEYFMFTAVQNCESSADFFVKQITKHQWSQFYIPDVIEHSDDWFALQRAAENNGLKYVVTDRNTVYGVATGGGNFTSYLASLGANTRLKLFNRRKNLALLGVLEIKNIWPDKECFFNLINGFHNVRWGKPCYEGRNAEFMNVLLDNLANEGHHINLSVMILAGQPISVLLDVTVNGRVYNLQSGYIESFAKNISLGTLHFGYNIEAAFNTDGVDCYDFMAGNGKNANYKAALANVTAQFNSVMLVRNPLLKLLYRAQHYLR